MSRTAAVPIAPQVWRIPTAPRDFVNSFAFVEDDGSVTLVDAGVAKAPPRIVAGLEAIGRRPADVTRILLTHAHPDHAGGAAELARRTGADVRLHEDEHAWATAGTVIDPPDQRYLLGRLFSRLPDPHYEPFAPGPALHDGEVLPVAGGLRVVHTPGHSPGHVSFLHEPTRTLITGDALFNVGWRRPRLSPRFLCADVPLAARTVHRLGELEYDVAAFTHGPEITERPRERIRSFLAGMSAA